MARWRIQVLETAYTTYTFEADTDDADVAREVFMEGVDTIELDERKIEGTETLDPELVV